jgi:hypothetical protein
MCRDEDLSSAAYFREQQCYLYRCTAGFGKNQATESGGTFYIKPLVRATETNEEREEEKERPGVEKNQRIIGGYSAATAFSTPLSCFEKCRTESRCDAASLTFEPETRFNCFRFQLADFSLETHKNDKWISYFKYKLDDPSTRETLSPLVEMLALVTKNDF